MDPPIGPQAPRPVTNMAHCSRSGAQRHHGPTRRDPTPRHVVQVAHSTSLRDPTPRQVQVALWTSVLDRSAVLTMRLRAIKDACALVAQARAPHPSTLLRMPTPHPSANRPSARPAVHPLPPHPPSTHPSPCPQARALAEEHRDEAATLPAEAAAAMASARLPAALLGDLAHEEVSVGEYIWGIGVLESPAVPRQLPSHYGPIVSLLRTLGALGPPFPLPPPHSLHSLHAPHTPTAAQLPAGALPLWPDLHTAADTRRPLRLNRRRALASVRRALRCRLQPGAPIILYYYTILFYYSTTLQSCSVSNQVRL